MAVTDLTGTTWVFNRYVEWEAGTYSINYTYNGINFTVLNFLTMGQWPEDVYGLIADNGYEIIPLRNSPTMVGSGIELEITGGTDATNASLIAWLEANATQIQTETEYTLRINGVVTDEYNGRKIKYLHYNGNDYKIKAAAGSNFTLSNGDYLETSDGNLFTVTEV